MLYKQFKIKFRKYLIVNMKTSGASSHKNNNKTKQNKNIKQKKKKKKERNPTKNQYSTLYWYSGNFDNSRISLADHRSPNVKPVSVF